MDQKWLLWLGLGVLGLLARKGTPVNTPSSIPPASGDAIDPERAEVVAAAMSQVNQANVQEYWASALPSAVNPKGDWCGVFALWALHQAGLGLDLQWKIGLGFEFHLPQTKHPEPGDIAYFDKPFQHRAVVGALLPGNRVQLINGNSTGGLVRLSTKAISDATSYYSIEPLLHKGQVSA